MKPISSQRFRLYAISIASLAAVSSAEVHAEPVVWVGADGGFWDIATNWSPTLPGATSDVALGLSNTTFRLGSVSINALDGAGNLSMVGGSLSIASTSSTGALSLSNGTVTGAGTLNVGGPSTWGGNGVQSGTGITNFNGALAISGTAEPTLVGRTVNFNGTTTWNGNGGQGSIFFTGGGAVMNNTGTWVDQNTGGVGIAFNEGGTIATFNNSGTYSRTGSGGTTSIDVVFNNTGSIQIRGGTLALAAGGQSTGAIDVSSGAILALNSGTFALSQLAAGTGTGTLAVAGATVNATGTDAFTGRLAVSGGTLNLTGAFNAGSLALSNGTVTGPGTLNVGGPSTWGGNGVQSGTGITNFNGALAISGTAEPTLVGRTVNFNGTTTWNGNGGQGSIFFTGGGAVMNNTGTWVDQNNGGVGIANNEGGATTTFTNRGTYIKTGTGTTNLSPVLYVNAGTTDVEAGILDLPANFNNTGTLKGSGTLSTNLITNNGHVAPGDDPSTLTIAGNFLQTAAGSFDVEIENAATHDLLKVDGSAVLSGALDLICYDDCNVVEGQTFAILDANPNQLTGAFSDVITSGFGSEQFGVIYDRANGEVLLSALPSQAQAVKEPETMPLLGLGMAVLWLVSRRAAKIGGKLSAAGTESMPNQEPSWRSASESPSRPWLKVLAVWQHTASPSV